MSTHSATSVPVIQDSRLLYYLIREIKTWLNINHITVHNNTILYISKLKEQLLKLYYYTHLSKVSRDPYVAADTKMASKMDTPVSSEPRTEDNLWKILKQTSTGSEDAAASCSVPSDDARAPSDCVTREEEKTTPAEVTEAKELLVVAEGDSVAIKVGEEELKELQQHCGGCTAGMLKVSPIRSASGKKKKS